MTSDERGATSEKAPPSLSSGRVSAISPQVKLERRVSLFFAGFFYSFLALSAGVWLFATNVSLAGLLQLTRPLSEIGLGLGAGVLMAAACAGIVRISNPARDLEREFGWILGEQRAHEILLLAVMSGIAEEIFFRGAMAAAMGPLMAALVFGLLHWPVNRSFRLWPAFALAAGAVFTLEMILTKGLVAPILTHATVNGINLWRITGKYRQWKE